VNKITDCLIVTVVLKKGFICANHLGIFLQPLPHAGTQADNAFDPVGRQKRVAQDGLGLLADAVHTASPLHQADDGPGQIIIHHDRHILQVLPFAQYVSSNKDVEFLIGHNPRALVVAHRAEAPGKLRRVVRVASDRGKAAYPTSVQLCSQVVHRVGKLGEDNKLLAPMLVSNEAEKRRELGITVGVPVTALLQHPQQRGAIGVEVPGELRQKAVGTEPAEAPLERSGILGIDLSGAVAKIGLGV